MTSPMLSVVPAPTDPAADQPPETVAPAPTLLAALNAIPTQDRAVLARKLLAVGRELATLPRDRVNTAANYTYASADRVYAAIRGPLAHEGLILLPSHRGHGDQVLVTPAGERSVQTTVRIGFVFVDSETGAMVELEWIGRAEDAGDKGVSKAQTSTLKTFLRALFVWPHGDDPEADASTDRRAAERATAETSPATADQREQLDRLLSERNPSRGEAVNLLRVCAGYPPRDEERAAAQFDQTFKRLPSGVAARAIQYLSQGGAFPAEGATSGQQQMLAAIKRTLNITDEVFLSALRDPTEPAPADGQATPEAVEAAIDAVSAAAVDTATQKLIALAAARPQNVASDQTIPAPINVATEELIALAMAHHEKRAGGPTATAPTDTEPAASRPEAEDARDKFDSAGAGGEPDEAAEWAAAAVGDEGAAPISVQQPSAVPTDIVASFAP